MAAVSAVASIEGRGAAWRECVPDAGRLRIPTELADRLDDGGCFIVQGRGSSEGTQGRRVAVDDLYGAVESLALATGIDARAFLPSKEELQAQLQEAPAQTSTTEEGSAFRNRYVVVDERARAGVVFVVSTGSGHLLDEDGEQPFVRFVARLVRRQDAALFACKRLDRGAREDWGAAPLMIALRTREGYLFDDDGLGKLDQARGITSFLKGGGSRNQADDLPFQTRSGQRTLSDGEMRGGRARYHGPNVPPPGFGVAWLKAAGTPTERVLFVDTDDARPGEAEVAYGLPEVYTDHDPQQRVDQVANVRFVLSVLGKPGWTVVRLGAELAHRKFSTPGLRQRHGPAATLPNDRESARLVIATIMDNLEVYETGVLRRELGAGVEPVEIAGCWPPDGKPWATREDFERIRAYRAHRDAQAGKATRLTFAGVKATYNGTPVRMTTYSVDPSRAGTRPPRYEFLLESVYPYHQRKPDEHVLLDWEPFAESLVEAFAAAGETPLRILSEADLDEEADDGLAQLRAETAASHRELERLHARLTALAARLEEVDDDGALVLRGAMLQQVQDTYNSIADTDLPVAQQRYQALTTELEQRSAQRQAATSVDAALQLIESLRDPTDRRYRHRWLDSIHQLKFHTEPIVRNGNRGKRLSWTGAVRLAHDDQEFLLPFHGSVETGAAATAPQRAASTAARVAAAMAHGTPYPHAAPARKLLTPRQLAEHLGANPDRFPLSSCDDPRITRLAVACLQRPHDTAETIAHDLDSDPRLVARIHEIHTGQHVPAHWRQRHPRAEAAFYVIAAHHAGHVTPHQVSDLTGQTRQQAYKAAARLRATGLWNGQRNHGYHLHPCHCGSTSRALLAIPEPHGPVCLTCRHDPDGLHWPADPYDHYLAHPDLWTRPG